MSNTPSSKSKSHDRYCLANNFLCNLFANLDASFISMRSDATDRVQIEQVVEFDIPTIVTDTLDQYLLEEGALEIEPVQIDIELDANQADLEVVSHMNLFKQGTGNIFISNNVTIATFATSTINTFASLQIGEIATTRLVIGNNTVFTSEVPTTNTGILIVDSYQNISANQSFFTNTTVSDTVLTLKLPFGDSSNTIAGMVHLFWFKFAILSHLFKLIEYLSQESRTPFIDLPPIA